MNKVIEISFIISYAILVFFILYFIKQQDLCLEDQGLSFYNAIKSFFEFFLILLSLILASMMVLFNIINNDGKKELIRLIIISFFVIFIIFILYLPLCFFTEFNSCNYRYFLSNHPKLNSLSIYSIFITLILSMAFLGVLILSCYQNITKNLPIPLTEQTQPKDPAELSQQENIHVHIHIHKR